MEWLPQSICAAGALLSRVLYRTFPPPSLIARVNVELLGLLSELILLPWSFLSLRRRSARPPQGSGTWIEYTRAPVHSDAVIVWLPGGGFIYHDHWHIAVAQALLPQIARETGSAPSMLIYNYPLPAKLDRTPQEIARVITWLRNECGFRRVVLAGDSAGGFLVMQHALSERLAHDPALQIDAAISMYPVLDLTLSGASYAENEYRDGLHVTLAITGVASFAGASTSIAELRAASPAFAPRTVLQRLAPPAGGPRIVVVSGERDLLRSDVESFLAALDAAVPATAANEVDAPPGPVCHVRVDDGAFGVHCGALLPGPLVGRAPSVRRALDAVCAACVDVVLKTAPG